jgi:ubiquinone biosynthesis protein COQ4
MDNGTSQTFSATSPLRAKLPYIQFQPRRAFRAARIIAKDPDDLPQVFTIIESLSIDTLSRTTAQFDRSESGRRLLATRPDIVTLLADRAALAQLPEGSLGRAYLAFVERENISAEGIRAAEVAGMSEASTIPTPLGWVHGRLRDTHDLWHAITGYSGDVLGEAALLGFIMAQTWNPGVGLIIGIAVAKMRDPKVGGGVHARKTIMDGFRRGMKAEWFPAQEWESMLALPLEEVRKRLNVGAPPVYREVRSTVLKTIPTPAA